MDTLTLFSVVVGLLGVLAAWGGLVGFRRFWAHLGYLRDIDAADPVTVHRPPVRAHERSRLVWGGRRRD
ncbi:hypothetical protein [Kutzneria buriramensis]|uniref:Uncharacterized protein n=1 Tax=Kutzneria buriramensis TaxID=1045776 RepID=A0A3E0HPG5_9PSEU|nr:hypothetical protein [Kutzneria buriramensis]REH48297.1 hypothetical protein BCF44_105155 [Kutzneria buriramensis]